jgi:deoxyribodipyrimidine photolyase
MHQIFLLLRLQTKFIPSFNKSSITNASQDQLVNSGDKVTLDEDNTGLQAALQSSKQVIPCFIFDPRQIEDSQNPYKSNNALQFMIESLIDLDKQLLLTLIKSSSDNDRSSKLYIFYGEQENVIEQLILKEKIDAVFVKI